MTTSANSVIAAMDQRRPGMRPGKLILLLFFCQGHHLAHHGEPLFAEPIYATGRGITVDEATGEPAQQPADNRQLLTISRAVTRYGDLSPADLRTLILASLPWELATKRSADPRIEWAWLRDWFRRPDETDDPDDERPNRAEMTEARAWYRAKRGG